jgi:integrase
MRRYGELAGLPPAVCHPHGLRHAGARLRRRRGRATPFELQPILGHANIQTTMIYVTEELDEPEDPQAACVDEFFSAVAGARMLYSRASTPA